MATLEFRIQAEPGALPFETLVALFRRTYLVLADMDRVISRRRDGTIRWRVASLSDGSVKATLVGNGKPGAEEDIANRIGEGFVAGLNAIERRAGLPKYMSDRGLKHLRSLARNLAGPGRLALNVTYVEKKLTAEFTASAEESISSLTRPTYFAIGSIIGALELVSLHKRNHFEVYDEVSGRPVRSTFANEQLEQVRLALGRRVMLTGIIRRNSLGQPLAVDQSRLTILPPDSDAPDTARLVGLDPNYTGRRSTEDYLEYLRNA